MEKGYRKTRDAELIAHWHHPFDSFQTSIKDFYIAVERAVAQRAIPQVSMSRVAWREAGLLSAEREYLRIEWRRYICDICAAPMGNGFFFSSWMCIRKLKLTPWHIIGMVLFFFIVLPLIFTIFLAIPIIGFLVIMTLILRSGAIQLPQPAEEFLLGLTFIIPIINVYYRGSSYYELDTASMFQGIIHKAFLEAVDNFTEVNGIPRIFGS